MMNWPANLIDATEAVRSRKLRARDLVEEACRRAETRGVELNCIVEVEREAAMREADAIDRALDAGQPVGLLAGVPLAHKDMIARAGHLSECGSLIRKGHRATETAPLLDRLAAAGAVTTARLHMAEFAMSPTGHNVHLGRCRNPHDPERITGGSSSGSGAAVAAGIVYGALGTDTGGSIRLPAGICGIVGLKPTQGRLDGSGVFPLAPSLDCVGPLARTVRDCARLFDVLTGDAVQAPGPCEAGIGRPREPMRVAWPTTYYFADLDPEIGAALDGFRHRMERDGWRFGSVHPSDQTLMAERNTLVLGYESALVHGPDLAAHGDLYGAQVLKRLEAGQRVPVADYRQAIDERPRLRARFLEEVFGQHDVMITPLLRFPVPTGATTDVADGPAMSAVLGRIAHTMRPISYLGLPALAMPIARDRDGMPIAIQIVAPPGQEALLFRAAAAIKAASGVLD